jgi:hypothetical protein
MGYLRNGFEETINEVLNELDNITRLKWNYLKNK